VLEAKGPTMNLNSASQMRNTVFQQRRVSGGSLGGGSAMSPIARVKSSLMGTTARQKLLQFKLVAKQRETTLEAGDKAMIKS